MPERRETDELGMWVFLASEMLFFGALFLAYFVYRFAHPAAFAAGSRECDLALGTINTLVLIASSWCMAMAVEAAKNGGRRRALAFLAAVAVLGTVFLGIKAHEYAHKIQHGLYPGRPFTTAHREEGIELFFSLYFVMTGLHAVHLIIGLGLLAWMSALICRGTQVTEMFFKLDTLGLYWHFVDMVWIFLFPMFYLIGRHG